MHGNKVTNSKKKIEKRKKKLLLNYLVQQKMYVK